MKMLEPDLDCRFFEQGLVVHNPDEPFWTSICHGPYFLPPTLILQNRLTQIFDCFVFHLDSSFFVDTIKDHNVT